MQPIWMILIPFLGAAACLLLRGRFVAWAGLTASGATFGTCLAQLLQVWNQDVIRIDLGGWTAPLGIGLYLDGLGMMFLLLTALVGLLVGVYANGFFGRAADYRRMEPYFWPIWLVLWGGLNGVYLSSDVFNAYVLLEVVGLAAVGLTILSGTRESLVAGLRYLLAAMFGSLIYLLGVALLYAEIGHLNMFLLAEQMRVSLPAVIAFGLMTGGLLIKSALLPFHFWLPPAHAGAPAPVSAILSGVVTKASFFLLLRIWFVVFPMLSVPLTGQLLGMLGGAAVLWGSLQAVRQTRLKLLIAYSTVGQLGYLFFLFALLAPSGGGVGTEEWAVMAWTGTVFHVFSHGLAKASLFMAAGCLLLAMGTDELAAMPDMAGRMPVITFTLGVAGVSLMGLPPSAGFVAKWMLLKACLVSGQWWWAVVIALGGLLTAAYVFKILAFAFVPASDKNANSHPDPIENKRVSESKEAQVVRPVPPLMTLAALALAVLCVLFGFRAEEVIALLPHDLGLDALLGGLHSASSSGERP